MFARVLGKKAPFLEIQSREHLARGGTHHFDEPSARIVITRTWSKKIAWLHMWEELGRCQEKV